MSDVERPPIPSVDGYTYGDIVEHKGQRGVIYELSTSGTCTVKVIPITDARYLPDDPDWPLDECIRVGALPDDSVFTATDGDA